MAESKKGGYSSRPLWQWIVIYAVIGAVVYGLIYYFVFGKSSNSSGGQYSGNATSSGQPTTSTPSGNATFSY